jgi:hypothetical protein
MFGVNLQMITPEGDWRLQMRGPWTAKKFAGNPGRIAVTSGK